MDTLRGFNWQTALAILLNLVIGCDAMLTMDQKQGLIIGCSIGGSVLVIVVIILLTLCCRSSKKEKEEKKKKSQYLYYQDRSLHSDFTSKPVHNGYSNGHLPRGGAPKLERSRSDVTSARTNHVMPEWRRKQDFRGDNGSQLSGHSASDISVPNGIWTSNPTLTRGLYPKQAQVVPPKGYLVSNGRANQYESEPTLNNKKAHKKSKYGHNNNILSAVNEESMYPVSLDPSVWDKSKEAKNHKNKSTPATKPAKRTPSGKARDVTSTRGDKARLISPNGKSSPDSESQTVARVFSNPSFKKDPQSRPTSSNSQENPFVAKVYSDYQLPKDFLPDKKASSKHGGQIVRVYSDYSKDHPQKVQQIPRSSSNISNRNGVNAAKSRVTPSSSYDSSGEPKYMQPQDAYKMTRSDLILHKAGKPVSRTQSNLERSSANPGTAVRPTNKQAKRSSSHPKQAPQKSGKHAKNSSKDRDAKRNSQLSKGNDTRQNGLQSVSVIDVNGVESSVVRSDSVAMVHAQTAEQMRNTGRPTSISEEVQEIHITDNDSPNSTTYLVNVPKSSGSDSDSPKTGNHLDDPSVIYAAPLKRESRPNSLVVTVPTEPVQVLPDTTTPLSPVPPPVPPVTSLRLEDPSNPTEPGDRSTSKTESLPDGQASPRAESALSHPASVKSRRRLKSTTSDGDGHSTGKSVIGDAFQFLDEFDDNVSTDGELDRF